MRGGNTRFRAIPVEGRFWGRVDQSGACWLWTAGKSRTGYGAISANGKQEGAHRVSWRLAHGPIPEGLWVLHHCDTKACVRPDHLYLGTHDDNMRDAVVRGRALAGERNPNARLTTQAVDEIRSSSLSAREMAGRFGVVPAHIRRIRRGGSWRGTMRLRSTARYMRESQDERAGLTLGLT